ncbi:MAG: family 20 glycosylhydrolase [Victivallales bacterium]|nr:family 20 glycosylhydrolase [Victivallales bacterium]
MSISHRYEIAEFYPQPKQVILGEGISELARDVRLTTNNVSPVERKALRLILSDADVHVVANKKKYVIDARVENEDAFDFKDVPEILRREFYELRIQGSEIFIRTPHQEGIVWAAQTLSTLFHIMFNGFAVPNLIIRDWPSIPLRGVLTDCNWGNERMSRTDWYQAIDAISSFKLNAMCVGVYNCEPSCRVSHPEMPSEFMMTPVSQEPTDTDPRSLSHFRYYNLKYDRWYEREVPPAMFEEDFFEDVINYGRERGVAIYPYFNLLSSSTLLPTILPELSAKNAKGKPTHAALCLTSKAAREGLLEFLGKFLAKFYPDGVKYFHVGLAELKDIHAHEEDGGCESAWCKCAQCKAISEDKRLAAFLEFLVKGLVARGVEKVVIYSNLLNELKGFRAAVASLLKKASVKGHLAVDFQDRGNERGKKYTAVCTPKGFADSWISPLGGVGNYSNYVSCRSLLDAGVFAAFRLGFQGIMSAYQFDPAYLDHLALLGVRTWEGKDSAGESLEEMRVRWAELIFGGMGRRYLRALEQLDHAAANPTYSVCLPFRYFVIQGTKKPQGSMLPAYPETALTALEKHAKAGEELAKVSAEATEAADFFAKQLEGDRFTRQPDGEHRPDPLLECLRSLYAAAQRVSIHADFFQALLKIKGALAKRGGAAAAIKVADAAMARLLEQLKVIEGNLPDWLLWFNMQQFGCHKLVLEQVRRQLVQKTPPAKFNWNLPLDWEIPEDK